MIIALSRSLWGPPFPLTALKFRPSKTDNDDGGKIHFGKVICGIVLMSNQAVPPCYLAKQGKREERGGRGE